MADFAVAYERTLINEGGYVNHTVAGDRGGQTFAGISRRYHPQWQGWAMLDGGGQPPAELVRQFYKQTFWDKMALDQVNSQAIAESIYDFGVNANTDVATKLAQLTVGTTPDGVLGPRTLQELNSVDPKMFILGYTVAKISRYRDIVMRDKSQSKFLLGWINRTLKGLV